MNKLKILELIEDKVKKTPNNVCIFDGKKNISYIEFWKECISFSNTNGISVFLLFFFFKVNPFSASLIMA